MLTLAREPQSVFHILLSSLKFWKATLFKVIPLTLLGVITTSLPIFFIAELNTHDTFLSLNFLKDKLIYLPFFYILIVLTFTMVIYRTHMAITSDPKGNGKAFITSIKLLPKTVLAFLIFSFIVSLGLLGIIPGIMLSCFLIMYVPLIIIDNLSLSKAFTKSFRLVTGHWWRTFFIFFILFFVQFLLSLLIDISVHGILGNLVSWGAPILWKIHNVLRIVFSVLFYPLVACVYLVVLQDLKIRTHLFYNKQVTTEKLDS